MSGPRSDSSAGPTSQEWRDLLARFPAAPPDLIVRRELRRRTDSKFVLTPASAAELLLAITGDYTVLGAGDELVAAYRTLYFDTPELEFFHEQRRGRRVRHKVRVRHYPDRRLTLLEVKARRSEIETTKFWRKRAYGDNALDSADQAFVDLHTGIHRTVFPQVWTDFRRVTLLGIRANERVTIDLDLRMGPHGRSFPAVAIVEVKQWPYCRGTPVMSAMRAAGWRPGWASKYCSAIALTHPELHPNALLPGLRDLERGAA